MDAVLTAAAETRSPVIVQVSVKTVKVMGAKLIRLMFEEMAGARARPRHAAPGPLPGSQGDRGVRGGGLELGAVRRLQAHLRRQHGADQGGGGAGAPTRRGGGRRTGGREGRRGRRGQRRRRRGRGARQGRGFHPRDAASTASPRPSARRTACTRARPKINFQRVSEIVAAEPVPLVVHGGTGLSEETFQRADPPRRAEGQHLDAAQDHVWPTASASYLAEKPTEYDPLKLLGAVKKKLVAQVAEFMRIFGSEGKAA